MHAHKSFKAFTKAIDEEAREVEQIVSVFNNVDFAGDRVLEGAFTKSLQKWSESGDPIPVYYSHQWENPDSLIGEVVEAKELAPGDELLPDGLKDLGGLYVRYTVDDRPAADTIFQHLKRRRIKQASFAYDVVRDRKNSDGTNDLIELDIIEVGPTLLGMNPATVDGLLSAKSMGAIAEEAGVTEEQAAKVLEAVEKSSSHTFIPSDEDETKCAFCGKTSRTNAHISKLSRDESDAKSESDATLSDEDDDNESVANAEAGDGNAEGNETEESESGNSDEVEQFKTRLNLIALSSLFP